MNQKSIYFLFDDPEEHTQLTEFLKSYYKITSEPISFFIDQMKTKELYFEIDQRLSKHTFDFLMIQQGSHLELFDSEKRRIKIDFDNDKSNYARKVIAKDPFLRAIGKDRRNVLDVSAGLGIDAVFLAQHGHDVTAVERNPLLFTLLSHGKRKSQYLSKWNINFVFGDAIEFVKTRMKDHSFDCIYFDPMFPDKAKSALPRQEMVLFRQLVGGDADAKDVLAALLERPGRIVVKRPSCAEPIAFKPTNAFESKLIRFDIYEGK